MPQRPTIARVYQTGNFSFCLELSNGDTLAASFGTRRGLTYELDFTAFDSDHREVVGPCNLAMQEVPHEQA